MSLSSNMMGEKLLTQNDMDEKFLRRAFKIARESVAHGNQPFGAIVVHQNGDVICEAENTELTKGCTHHSEMNAIRKLEKMKLSPDVITTLTLYSSTECCQMCTGAVNRMKIGRVVYGCPAAKMSEIAHSGEKKSVKHTVQFERLISLENE